MFGSLVPTVVQLPTYECPKRLTLLTPAPVPNGTAERDQLVAFSEQSSSRRRGRRRVSADLEPPPVGALVVDTKRVMFGEFRAVAGPHWILRSLRSRAEWEAEPECVRLVDEMERLRAETDRANARSRSERL
ncbi:hypothetical protein GCM10027091_74100 [Streptomyces daliensis]